MRDVGQGTSRRRRGHSLITHGTPRRDIRRHQQDRADQGACSATLSGTGYHQSTWPFFCMTHNPATTPCRRGGSRLSWLATAGGRPHADTLAHQHQRLAPWTSPLFGHKLVTNSMSWAGIGRYELGVGVPKLQLTRPFRHPAASAGMAERRVRSLSVGTEPGAVGTRQRPRWAWAANSSTVCAVADPGGAA